MQTNYGEFMSQYIMDSFAGEVMQPDRRNKVTLKRAKWAKAIGNDPNKGLAVVKRNIPRIDKYILSKGETPLTDLVGKSVQAFTLKKKEIDDVSRSLDIPESEAQIFLDEAESKGIDINHPDADNFLGEIFSAIAPVAQKGIDKIAAKRAAKGKPAGIFGTLASGGTGAYNQIRGLTPAQLAAMNTETENPDTPGQKKNFLSDIKLFGKDIIDKVGDAERKKQVQKMIPLFIIGALLLFLVIFFAVKSGKK
jgi:hypothetical protein